MAWYTRPVFVSSTFKDVQAERDSLRDVVFRGIDDNLKEYHRRLEPIDLRWGVETVETPEQERKELLVLKVCLDEIERCRPFLLVILGDRYGWTPPAHRMQTAIDEKGFVTKVENKSVTALEIEYGVLDSPEQKKRSFFYFRAITNYKDMPLATRALYSDLHKGIVESKSLTDKEKQELSDLFVARQSGTLSADGLARLAQLVTKDPMVEQGHKLLEELKCRIEQDPGLKDRVKRYDAWWDQQTGRVGVPAKWADKVEADLWSELKQECEEGSTAVETSWQGQERTALEEFVELRSRDFVGREALLDELHAFSFSPPQSNTWGLCLHGGPGTGKSALFATLIRKLQKEQEQGHCLLLAHAGGISLRAGNVDALIRRWIQELARHLKFKDDDPSKDLTTLDEKKKLFAELLSRTSVNTRVVCLIDALNQFERSAIARYLTWLPELWPKNARLITTCIAGCESEALSKKTGVALKELPRLDENEAEAIVQSICKRYHRTLNPSITKRLLEKKRPDAVLSCANPLWLTIAVEQLNLLDEDDFSAADKLEGSPEQKLHAFMLKTVEEFPSTIEELYAALYRRAHERFGQRYGIGWIPEMLGLIACSRFGLREKDLEALLCNIEAQKQGKENNAGFVAEFGMNFTLQFSAVRRYLSAHLVQRDEMGLWDFTHAQGRKSIQDSRFRIQDSKSESANPELSFHRKIAVHLEGLERGDGLRTREIMWHYMKGDLKQQAAVFLGQANQQEKTGAAKVIALAAADGDDLYTNSVIEWALAILNQEQKHVETWWICTFFNYDLSDAMVNIVVIKARAMVLVATRETLEKLHRKDPNDTQVARDLGINYGNLGNLLIQLGDTSQGLQYYKQAMQIGEELHSKYWENSQVTRDLFISYGNLGDISIQLGNTSQALQYYKQVLQITEELHSKNPDDSLAARDLGISYGKLGNLSVQLGDTSQGLQYYKQAMQIREKLHDKDPNDAQVSREYAISNGKLGDLSVQLGDTSQGLQYYKKAMQILEELYRNDPNDKLVARDLCNSYQDFGDLLVQLGDTSQGLGYYKQTIQIHEDLHRKDPDDAQVVREYGHSYLKLGDLSVQLGDTSQGLGYYKQDMQICEKLYRKSPDDAHVIRDLGIIYERMGDLSVKLGDTSQGLQYYKQAMQIREELQQKDPNDAQTTRDLGLIYSRMGGLSVKLEDTFQGLTYYKQAMQISEKLNQKDPDNKLVPDDLRLIYSRMGGLSVKLGDTSQGLQYYKQAMQIGKELHKKYPNDARAARDLSFYYHILGNLSVQLGNTDQGILYQTKAMEIREELHRKFPDDAQAIQDLSVSYSILAEIFREQNKNGEANRYWLFFKDAILYMKQHDMFVDSSFEELFQKIQRL
jgi:tetratricopeptide (TPR) repeat protein